MKFYSVICDCGYSSTAKAKNRNRAYKGLCPECSGEMCWDFRFNMVSDQLGEGVKGILNHADGKIYDSKSAYHRTLRERGFHIREDKEPPKIREKSIAPGLKQDIANAYRQHT